MRSILFYIGPIPIRAYGLMLWIALVVALFRTLRASKKSSVQSNHVADIAFYAVFAGVIFAHLGSILLDLPIYLRNPREIFGLWSGILSPSGGIKGLSFHGGFIGAVFVTWLYCRAKKLDFMEVIDLFAPGIAIGYAITRIGCFLNGCCYGVPTDLPWGVHFHLDPTSKAVTPASHPVQLYASAANALIFLGLVFIERRRRFQGQVFFSYVGMYAVYRFLTEFLRKGVTAEVFWGGMTEAQWVSIVMFIASVWFLWVRRHTRIPEGKTSVAGTDRRKRK